MGSQRFVKYIFLIICMVAGNSPDVHAQGREPRNTIVSFSSYSTAILPVLIAESKGYFHDERVLPQLVQIRGAVSVTALISGSVHFITDLGSSLEAAVRGPKFKVVMVAGDRPQFELVAHPSIRSFADLKGKIVGVSSFGAASDMVTRAMLEKNGLRPDKDVTNRALGTPGVRMAALKTGAIHASILTPPSSFITVKEQGLVSLGSSADYVQSLHGGIITTEDLIRKNSELVTRFVKACLKGHLFYRTKRTEAIKLMMDRLKIDDPQIAEQNYNFHVPSTTSDGTVPTRLVQEVIDDRRKAAHIEKPINANDIFDFSFVRRAMSELKAIGWQP